MKLTIYNKIKLRNHHQAQHTIVNKEGSDRNPTKQHDSFSDSRNVNSGQEEAYT